MSVVRVIEAKREADGVTGETGGNSLVVKFSP